MIKKIILLTMIFFVFSCSVDTKTGFWENKQKPSIDKQLSELSFDDNISFNEFKENVIIYGKKSNFPNLDK